MTLCYNLSYMEESEMKRNVETDFEFIKEDFRDVLKRAIGTRSNSAFAKEADLSFGCISRYLNLKTEAAPTLATVNKIAKVAAPDVTYEELLQASGYDASKYALDDVVSVDPTEPQIGIMSTLLMSLMRVSFTWTMANTDSRLGGPISIRVENAPFEMWYFIPVNKLSITKEELITFLGSQEAGSIKPNGKVTFLTSSKAIYEQIVAMDMGLLSLRISVAYVSQDGTVDKEDYIKTAIELTPAERDVYMLTNSDKGSQQPLSL